MEKKIKNKTRVCEICHKLIYLDKDNYLHNKEFVGYKLFREGWYHRNCFQEAIESRKRISNVASNLLNRVSKMTDHLDPDGGKKVYEIKH